MPFYDDLDSLKGAGANVGPASPQGFYDELDAVMSQGKETVKQATATVAEKPTVSGETLAKTVPELRAFTPELKAQYPIKQEIPEEAVRGIQTQQFTDRLYRAVTGIEPEQAIKSEERLGAAMSRAPLVGMGFASPLIAAGFEGLQQAKNAIVSATKGEKYSPLEDRILAELLPKKTPTPVKIGAAGAEMIGDVALMGALASRAKAGLLRQTIKEIGLKLEKAGYGTGKIEVTKEAIKEAVKGTTLEKETERLLKAKALKVPGKASKSPKPVLEPSTTGVTEIVPSTPPETPKTGLQEVSAEVPGIKTTEAPVKGEKVIVAPDMPTVVYHGTTTPDKPLSMKAMENDVGIHFGNYDAAESRLRFKDGVINEYELTNVKNTLEVEDIQGSHDSPRAVYEMLEKSGGLREDQLKMLKENIPRTKVPQRYADDNLWLKQANQMLVDNGYTHLTYKNKAEGGWTWTALTDEGFKLRVGKAPEAETGVETIKKVAPSAPPGTVNFQDLVKTGRLDKKAIYAALEEKTRMRWKGTKGIGVVQRVSEEDKMFEIIGQAFTHLENRNWNSLTVPSLQKWLESAADSAVKRAINELSTPFGSEEVRKDIATLDTFVKDFQKEFGLEPDLAMIVGPKDAPTELTKKWGAEKVVRVYYQKLSTETGISYEGLLEQGIEPGQTQAKKKVEMHAGLGITAPTMQFPSVKEMAQNLRDTLGYTREAWHKISEPLRFFPQLRNYPQLKNAIRVEMIGANVETRAWLDKIYASTFGKLNAKDQQLTVDILKGRSQLERIRKGRISPIKEEDAQKALDEAIKQASPEVLIAAKKWNLLEQEMAKDLVQRGKLDPEQLMEDHVTFFVDAYTKDWMLWNSIPKRMKRPFRGYTKFAKGTTKEYRVDLDTLLASMYRIKLDNTLEDFSLKWLDKYDITKSLSDPIKAELFGVDKHGHPRSPKPNRIYEINGKPYIGYQFEHHPRQMFKTEEGLLALGRLHKVYLILEEISGVFNSFKPGYDALMGPLMFQINRANSFFKSTAIFSIFPKYNVNNLIGDAFMLYMQSPKAFLKIDKALRFLVKRAKDYTPEDENFASFLKRQRVLATFADAELTHFKENPLNLLRTSNHVSEFREKILRTALAYHLWDNLAAGKNLAPKFDWIPTKGLPVEDANGKIAREVLVDYLSTSHSFNRYIKGFAMPFGTWFAKAAGLLKSLFLKHPFKTLAAMLTPVLAVDLYNNTGDRKEIEQNLPDYVRNRTHIIIARSKRPNRAWVNVVQLPIDVIPLFPLVNIATKNAFRLANGEIDTMEEAARETISETGKSSIRLGEFLLSPLYRFFKGVWSNKDPILGTEIVPREGKVSASVWIPKMTAFAANTLVPPMSLAIRSGRRLEYMNDEGVPSAIKQWLMEWWDPVRAMGFQEVDLTGKEEELYQSADRATRKYNDYMVRFADDLSQAKQKPPAFYVDMAKQDGLVTTPQDEHAFMQGLVQVAKNPKFRILNLQEKLRHTKDPQQRAIIEQQILWTQRAKRIKRIRATPKGARGEALREFTGH